MTPVIIIACQSELTFRLQDPAFLDRVDKKQYIPKPCAEARYEILRTRYLELAQCGIIASIKGTTHDKAPAIDEDLDESVLLVSPPNGSPTNTRSSPGPCRSYRLLLIFDRPGPQEEEFMIIDNDTLPSYERAMLRFFSDESSWPRKLWTVAEKTEVR